MDWTTGMVEYWNGGLDSFSFVSCCIPYTRFRMVYTCNDLDSRT